MEGLESTVELPRFEVDAGRTDDTVHSANGQPGPDGANYATRWSRGMRSQVVLRERWTVDVVRIDRARILKGLTRRQLATIAHVDPDTLGDLLARRRRPTLGSLMAICSQLDLTLAEVIEF
jgi:DNA-binding Xre family transcriptional regulator